ncbi:MAG TPA: hypothetical protein VEZ59_04725, partial [Sphingopyxis sp.]|nr:hypothetical protein [Sphingopyxis sp.]
MNPFPRLAVLGLFTATAPLALHAAEPVAGQPVTEAPAVSEPVPVATDPLLTNPVPAPPVEPEPRLPAPVRAMIDAAVASGKDSEVETVAKFAKGTNPAAAEEIDLIVADFRAARTQAKQAEADAARARLA